MISTERQRVSTGSPKTERAMTAAMVLGSLLILNGCEKNETIARP